LLDSNHLRGEGLKCSLVACPKYVLGSLQLES
jgi:hypothetical protein